MMQINSAIELWLIDLEKCAPALEQLERRVPRLAVDDRDRIDAIRDPRERRDRVAAYTALRVLLERVAGPGVRGQSFVRAPGGKPRLGDGGVEFSLSHSEGLALIGLSRALPVGVDHEKLRAVRMLPRRMAEISAVGAGLGIKALPDLGTERTFLQAWARLEAFAKARGRGLAQTLADVGMRGQGRRQVPLNELKSAARHLVHGAGLAVHDVDVLPTFHGAMAAPRGARVTRAIAFPADRIGIEDLLVQQA